jgi:hypothetical protein
MKHLSSYCDGKPVAARPSVIIRITMVGLRISRRKSSCWTNSKALNVGPGCLQAISQIEGSVVNALTSESGYILD